MVLGAGLGKVLPDAIGPCSVQEKTGVIALRVVDEVHAAQVARECMRFFLMPQVSNWKPPAAQAAAQLSGIIPMNRKLMYDIRAVIFGLCDEDSVLELHKEHGCGIVTALVRVEGRAMGAIANNTMYLGGALDAECCQKAARFVHLCNRFRLPLLSLVDTPGFLVGPDAEADAVLRSGVEFISAAANASVPIIAVIVRKAFGLGAMAMAGGSLHVPMLTLAWPLAEFGAMGLEGAVRLGMRSVLQNISSEKEREDAVKAAVEELALRGRAVNVASLLEVDDVVEPEGTRARVVSALNAARL
jgi:acetyl-CoA carboxylase carboxyltransferase component